MNLGYLAAVVVLGGIILFHEFGHYLLARLNGIAVVEFSVGFGPRLLSWVSQKTGIRYSLKLLPLGGSCAMLGEFGEDEDEKEEVPDVKGVSFFDKGPLAKMAVIAAGPLFNFILAFVFSLVILSWAGIDPAVIAGTSEGMPAETAGLKEGDVITKLDGRKIHLSREISMYLMTAGQDPVQVEYRRYDETSSSWTTEHTVIQSWRSMNPSGERFPLLKETLLGLILCRFFFLRGSHLLVVGFRVFSGILNLLL